MSLEDGCLMCCVPHAINLRGHAALCYHGLNLYFITTATKLFRIWTGYTAGSSAAWFRTRVTSYYSARGEGFRNKDIIRQRIELHKRIQLFLISMRTSLKCDWNVAFCGSCTNHADTFKHRLLSDYFATLIVMIRHLSPKLSKLSA